METFQLPISEDSKREMVRTFRHGLSMAKDGLNNISSFYNNGHGLAKWSYIYENQYKELKTEELITFQGRRKSWKVAGVLDKESSYLFMFISRGNLLHRQSTIFYGNNPMYYMSAFAAVYNKNFEENLPAVQRLPLQTTFDLAFDMDEARKITSEVLGGCNVEVKRFCLIVADVEGYELKSTEAVVVDEDLRELYREDWSEFIS